MKRWRSAQGPRRVSEKVLTAIRWRQIVILVPLLFGPLLSCSGSGGEGAGPSISPTADTTSPVVLSVFPGEDATGVSLTPAITATFSKVMDASSLTATTFTVKDAQGNLILGTISSTGTTATFVPSVALAPSSSYLATITAGVIDRARNALPSDYFWPFATTTVPDTTPPTVIATTPTNGATGVLVNTTVTATFSEVMDVSSINTATFTVKEASGNPVTGTVSYVGARATFSPATKLAVSTTYTATITTGATDLAGNALSTNYSWTFATRDLATPPQYTITGLGTLGGSYSVARGINGTGQVVGDSYTASGAVHAFLYRNGAMTDLGTLGGTYSVARGINGTGQVVGDSYTASGAAHAFLYQNGRMTDLGTLGSGYSVARGINGTGQVVGDSYTASGAAHAFLYRNGAMTDLGTLGGTTSTAYGINDAGQVVGASSLAGNETVHAFLYQNGRMTDLGTMGGCGDSWAFGINAVGQLVGDSYITCSSVHGFLYQNGTWTDLGTLGRETSSATAINNSGQVVGWSYIVDPFASHAFLYQNGTMFDLNNLLVNGSGWELTHASAINDHGQIVGWGRYAFGGFEAVLLTPVPPPGAQ